MNTKIDLDRASSSLPAVSAFYASTTSASELTDAQLLRLYRCANGNTLRFEDVSIVDALARAGYAKEGIGRVVTVTAQGQHYLRMNAVRLRLAQMGARG